MTPSIAQDLVLNPPPLLIGQCLVSPELPQFLAARGTAMDTPEFDVEMSFLDDGGEAVPPPAPRPRFLRKPSPAGPMGGNFMAGGLLGLSPLTPR